jgi:hypothetical protein
MVRPVNFESFSRAIESGRLSPQEIAKFVELDPNAPVIRLRIRRGVLRDPVPVGFDIDEVIYRLDRQQQERGRAQRARSGVKLPVVVADGDSWFHLPWPILGFPTAIADRINDDKLFDVDNVAHWGDTLGQRIQKKRYLQELAKGRAHSLILSGGGNDMQISLAAHQFLVPYDATIPIEQSISSIGRQVLAGVTDGYGTILTEVRAAHPTIKILCYSYDYPKPSAQHREYIGKHLDALGYPRATWPALVRVIMAELSSAIMCAVAKHPGVRFLDCFGVAQPWPWFNDMHPDDDGFKALAKWFEAHMATATHGIALRKRSAPKPTLAKRSRKRRTKKAGKSRKNSR